MITITTESHGCAPSFDASELPHPRIAFVEPSSTSRPHPVSVPGKLLVITASDLDTQVVSDAWYALLLLRGPRVAYWAKGYALRRAIRAGEYPNCPMTLPEAMAILKFFDHLHVNNCKELTISCEYGKSRSVTTAQFLDALQQGRVLPTEREAKNGYINRLLRLANLKEQERLNKCLR
ncbi:hypothetical protein [Pseudomonas serbica]|jgi:hypothetical protein|uniref:hypothetical protein n=1 Tax=Pseudomonas serbica TaxID=2965074 RepID=UPI00237C2D99|nr:hypothetical protein [Pseudomonas serbica]